MQKCVLLPINLRAKLVMIRQRIRLSGGMSFCCQCEETFSDTRDRELNKVFTNGTLVDPELLTDEQAGHCVAISEQPSEDGKDTKNNFGICVLDSSTSQFNLSAFEDDICRTKLETLMRQIRPKELLFTKVCHVPPFCASVQPLLRETYLCRQRGCSRIFYRLIVYGQVSARWKDSAMIKQLSS